MKKKGEFDGDDVSNVANFVSRMAAYDDLFERTLDAVVLIDFELFSILDLNSCSLKMLGETKDDILGRRITDWINPEYKNDFIKLLNDAKGSYYAKSKIFLWTSKEGKGIAMDVNVCTLKLNNGLQVIQVIGRDISTEIALRRRTELYLQELQAANSRLETLSMKDELTTLSNFRHFQALLQKEHELATAEDRIYSIIFLDLDHFKMYNDRNGHLAGDELLKVLGQLIRKNCRDSDYPARYGGEEFAILSKGTPKEVAIKIAHRIKATVEQYPFPHGEGQPLGVVSVSIGVASFPADGREPSQIINAADDAAYQSKRNGRNQVTVAMKKAA